MMQLEPDPYGKMHVRHFELVLWVENVPQFAATGN